MITNLEPDILECKVKWALGSITMMEFQLSYFKSWKMMLWKCCTQYASKSGKLSSGHKDWKRSVFILIPKKVNAKECSKYHTITLISHASKIMLKILQVRLQWFVSHELPDVQAGFRKGKGTRNQIANIHWIIQKARDFQKKTSTFALLTMPKPLTVWITTNWKIFQMIGIPSYLTCSWEISMQVKKQQLEPVMEQ